MQLARRSIALDGATVVITGGARGIGAKTAELFSQHGANVWIGDVDADIADQTARTIPHCRSARLDVTRRDSWDQFVAQVLKESGRIDILVNNAGVMPLGAFESEAESTTDLILDVNVRGVLNGMRAVIPFMITRGSGHVVNVASMAGMIPIPGMVTYNVCAVLPSAVRTELSSGVQLGGGMPTVDPEDVAQAVLKTLRTKAARTSVPEWVAPGWALVDALVPEFVQRAARSLMDDRRALTAMDPVGRSAYLDRIERQSKEHAAESDSELQA